MQRGTGMALFAMALGVLVIANDFTALNVALPAIEQDFDADVGTVQWTVNAYALTFGMVLVTGGRLADMFGRRRVFFIGTAIFASFSLLGALAERGLPDRDAGRDGRRRRSHVAGDPRHDVRPGARRAGRLRRRADPGVAGLGNAIGPLLGGLLTDELSWRAIFYLNLPVAAFAAPGDVGEGARAAQRGRPRADRLCRDRHALARARAPAPRVRPVGRLGGHRSSRARDGGRLAARARRVAVIEPRLGKAALVPKDVIDNCGFAAACLTVLCISGVFLGDPLRAAAHGEDPRLYGARAVAGMLPMLGTFGAVAFISDRIVARVGGIVAGTALLALGPLLLSFFGADRYPPWCRACSRRASGPGCSTRRSRPPR